MSRRLLVAVAASASLLVGAVSPAQAGNDDELTSRREAVSDRIDQVSGHLDDVSHELVEATERLQSTQNRLADARGELSVARAEVGTAQLADQQMRRALARAEQRLTDAQQALAVGRKRVARQRSAVAQLAVAQFQGETSELLNLSAALNAGSPRELTNQMAAMGDVLDHSSATLEGLQATQVLLAVQERQVHAAQRLVAQRRAAAAANLDRTQAARARALRAAEAVADLVDQRRAARVAARLAVVAERQRLAELRQERERVTELLAARARREARLSQVSSGSFDGTSNGFLSYPVAGSVTSAYGMRMHPILHIYKLHDGTDFGAPCGTPIRAAAPGKVIERYFNAGYGNRLIVADGFVKGVSLATAYNHLSAYAVAPGEHVQRGQVVGYVGTTGYSTGCHLHFMVYENGVTVDPMTWF
jgi:murein DD-endopeptidase MepM/ murein hydrolase activator NlpD